MKKNSKWLSIIMTVVILASSINIEKVLGNTSKGMIRVNAGLLEIATNSESYDVVTNAEDWINEKEDSFVYPVDTNNKEWRDFQSHDEMVEACTAPREILDSATTEELIELIVEYPLLCDMFFYDDIQSGIEALTMQSNIIKELLVRENLSQILLELYKEKEINEATNDYTIDFKEVSETVFLEALLAQQEIVENLTKEEQGELLVEVEKKMEEKEEIEIYNENETTFYDIGNENDILEELGFEDNRLSKLDNLLVHASGTTYVKTPKGTKVEVTISSYKGSSWETTITKQAKKDYPLAVVLSKSDNCYNCHSYAWYSRSTSNPYWMNNPKAYVTDKSYSYVGTKPTASGQIVEYKRQSGPVDTWVHSGVTINAIGGIKSKWGQGPLMQHTEKYQPYVGQYNVISYYKKN